MRIWSFHPKYLDTKGLIALWRESLLAQKVLRGETKGYRHHPQLQRFKKSADPLASIACYLNAVYEESLRRHYHFDRDKIGHYDSVETFTVTTGQLLYEWQHFQSKLFQRDRVLYDRFVDIKIPELHPLFKLIEGKIEAWEKMSSVSPKFIA
jgi:hypothetical protein